MQSVINLLTLLIDMKILITSFHTLSTIPLKRIWFWTKALDQVIHSPDLSTGICHTKVERTWELVTTG